MIGIRSGRDFNLIDGMPRPPIGVEPSRRSVGAWQELRRHLIRKHNQLQFVLGETMSSYGEAASVFQLAFGLNAALPTVYFAYRRTHDALARKLAEEISKIDPSMTFGERELIVIRHYVRYGFPAMRSTRLLGLAVAVLFAMALLLSLFGLVLSAIDATGHLDNWMVVLFSAFALVACPAVGTLYGFLMSYSERQIILRWNRAAVEHFVEPIKKSLTMQELGDKMKNLTQEFKTMAAELNYTTAQKERRMAWWALTQKWRNFFENRWKVFRR
jgi:hypothetical protein